jgi:hypothetical protein
VHQAAMVALAPETVPPSFIMEMCSPAHFPLGSTSIKQAFLLLTDLITTHSPEDCPTSPPAHARANTRPKQRPRIVTVRALELGSNPRCTLIRYDPADLAAALAACGEVAAAAASR